MAAAAEPNSKGRARIPRLHYCSSISAYVAYFPYRWPTAAIVQGHSGLIHTLKHTISSFSCIGHVAKSSVCQVWEREFNRGVVGGAGDIVLDAEQRNVTNEVQTRLRVE